MLIVFGFLALALTALLTAGRRRGGRVLAATCLMILWLGSLPIVSARLVHLFGTTTALQVDRLSSAEAIVVIAGGTRWNVPELGRPYPGRLTLDRLRYGAQLARLSGLPVLVAGGSASPGGLAEAAVMAQVMRDEQHVSPRWIEGRSANTRGNAFESSRILRPEGIHRIVLVAHAFDMPRAGRVFRAAGFEVIEAPCGIAVIDDLGPNDVLPHLRALEDTNWLLYEALATLVGAFRRAVPGE